MLDSSTPITCWNAIGIFGDRSCPQLQEFIHCRNCPVYTNAGRGLLNREIPDNSYFQDWSDHLSQRQTLQTGKTQSMVIFRLGAEWLGLKANLFKEVVPLTKVHSIPHRSNALLQGLVNIRGELQLCVSLHHFLGIQAIANPQKNRIVYERLVVISKDHNTWVFPVDEMHGIYTLSTDELQDLPSTVAKAANTYTQHILPWQSYEVSYLDDELLFYTLSRRAL